MSSESKVPFKSFRVLKAVHEYTTMHGPVREFDVQVEQITTQAEIQRQFIEDAIREKLEREPKP